MSGTDNARGDTSSVSANRVRYLPLGERAPDFKVASAVVHLDESSPHIHLVGVPVASGYKRGPEKQVAKTKVFTQEEIDTLEQVHEELQEDTQKVVEEYVKAKTDSAMKKDFLQFVTQEEPKSELAKLATKVWRTFRSWWDRNKKPEVEKTARESVLKKLQRHKQEATEQPVNDEKMDRKKDQYR